MVDNGGHENASNNRPFIAKTRRQKQSQQLGFVAHFGQRNGGSGIEKCVHRMRFRLWADFVYKRPDKRRPHGSFVQS